VILLLLNVHLQVYIFFLVAITMICLFFWMLACVRHVVAIFLFWICNENSVIVLRFRCIFIMSVNQNVLVLVVCLIFCFQTCLFFSFFIFSLPHDLSFYDSFLIEIFMLFDLILYFLKEIAENNTITSSWCRLLL